LDRSEKALVVGIIVVGNRGLSGSQAIGKKALMDFETRANCATLNIRHRKKKGWRFNRTAARVFATNSIFRLEKKF